MSTNKIIVKKKNATHIDFTESVTDQNYVLFLSVICTKNRAQPSVWLQPQLTLKKNPCHSTLLYPPKLYGFKPICVHKHKSRHGWEVKSHIQAWLLCFNTLKQATVIQLGCHPDTVCRQKPRGRRRRSWRNRSSPVIQQFGNTMRRLTVSKERQF